MASNWLVYRRRAPRLAAEVDGARPRADTDAMAVPLLSWLTRPALLRALASDARLVLRLLREPRVPVFLKALPALAALYLLSPLDAVPDLLPFAGQIDDVVAIVLAVKAFVALCPSSAVAFHRDALARRAPFAPMAQGDDVIEAEFRHDA